MKKFNVKRLVFISIFAALSFVLYLGPKFSLPIFPSFLEINFSMLPILICSFMLGPIDALICVLVRFAVKLPLSSTGFIGEIADLIIGSATCLAAGFTYKYLNVKHKTLFAFILAIVVWVAAGIITNAFFNIPMYSKFFEGKGFTDDGLQFIVNASSDAFKLISGGKIEVNKDNFMKYYLLVAVLPFNLIIASVVSLVTALVHKRLKVLYDRIGNE